MHFCLGKQKLILSYRLFQGGKENQGQTGVDIESCRRLMKKGFQERNLIAGQTG